MLQITLVSYLNFFYPQNHAGVLNLMPYTMLQITLVSYLHFFYPQNHAGVLKLMPYTMLQITLVSYLNFFLLPKPCWCSELNAVHDAANNSGFIPTLFTPKNHAGVLKLMPYTMLQITLVSYLHLPLVYLPKTMLVF